MTLIKADNPDKLIDIPEILTKVSDMLPDDFPKHIIAWDQDIKQVVVRFDTEVSLLPVIDCLNRNGIKHSVQTGIRIGETWFRIKPWRLIIWTYTP